MKVELIGQFMERFEDHEIDEDGSKIDCLYYLLNVMLWKDFENGFISGHKYKKITLFNTLKDCICFPLCAYTLIDSKDYDNKELKKVKYHFISKEDQDFLDTLMKNDVIIFKANIPATVIDNGINLNKTIGFHAYDFKNFFPQARLDFEKLLQALYIKENYKQNKTKHWIEKWVNSEST